MNALPFIVVYLAKANLKGFDYYQGLYLFDGLNIS